MHHRGGRGFQNWNFHRQSRRDQWDNRGQNNNFVRNDRSRSVTRFSDSHPGQRKNGWVNHNQRGRRSRSVGPPRRFYNKQGPSHEFHQGRGPPHGSQYGHSSWHEFHRTHPPPEFFTNQCSQKKWFPQHHTSRQRSYEHDSFMDQDSSNVPQWNDDCTKQLNSSNNVSKPLDRQVTQENVQVPIHPKKIDSLANGKQRDIQNRENGKLWVLDQKAFAFIASEVPKELQQQAKAAFELINDGVIKKVTTYHCHYCAVRCRDLQNLENHKTTQRHIKTRDKFLKNWSRTTEAENTVAFRNRNPTLINRN